MPVTVRLAGGGVIGIATVGEPDGYTDVANRFKYARR
jgi:hypothetical protein